MLRVDQNLGKVFKYSLDQLLEIRRESYIALQTNGVLKIAPWTWPSNFQFPCYGEMLL